MWRHAGRLLRRSALLRGGQLAQRAQHDVVRWQEQRLAEHGCRGCSKAAQRRHSSAACFAAQVQEAAVEPATASYDAQQIQARPLTACCFVTSTSLEMHGSWSPFAPSVLHILVAENGSCHTRYSRAWILSGNGLACTLAAPASAVCITLCAPSQSALSLLLLSVKLVFQDAYYKAHFPRARRCMKYWTTLLTRCRRATLTPSR